MRFGFIAGILLGAGVVLFGGCQYLGDNPRDQLASDIDLVQDQVQDLREVLEDLPEESEIRGTLEEKIEFLTEVGNELQARLEALPEDAGLFESVQPIVGTAAPFLPPPFGEILILVAGGLAANERRRRRNTEVATARVVRAIDSTGVISDADEITRLKLKAEMGDAGRAAVKKAKES